MSMKTIVRAFRRPGGCRKLRANGRARRLPRQADQDRRGLYRRRHDRHPDPRHQQQDQRIAEADLHHRKPSGRGGQYRQRICGARGADGYTLLAASVGPIAVNSSLNKLDYDPLTDLVPVVQFADVPNVLVVPPDTPVHNVAEFIAYAKQHSGKLNYSSTGIGASSHLASYMLMQKIGVQATHIPYKGADALNDLLSGRVQFMFATIPSVIGQIKAGGSCARARGQQYPPLRVRRGVPTIAENSFAGFKPDRGS